MSLLAGIAVAASLLASVEAKAQFVSGYSDWRKLPPDARAAWAMGAVDQILGAIPLSGNTTEQEEHTKHQRAVSECITDRIKATSGMLHEAVSDAYRANGDLWRMPASLMLRYVVLRMCAPEVNRAAAPANRTTLDPDMFLILLRAVAAQSGSDASPPQQPSRLR